MTPSYGYSRPDSGKSNFSGRSFFGPQQNKGSFAGFSGASGYSTTVTRPTAVPRQLVIAAVVLFGVLFGVGTLTVGAAPFGKQEAGRLSGFTGAPAGSIPTSAGATPPQPQPEVAAQPQAQEAAPPAAEVERLTPQQVFVAQTGDRLPIAHHTNDYNVVAPPSVSAALIDSVLTEYGSPAQGNGALFYDLGVQYGIDPAYALAFYIHESAAGTKGVARFTKSIGNIRTTPGYADYEGYRSYDSFADSIADFYKLIRELYVDGWGLTTPDTILPRYAPWGDNNNPEIYAANVEQLVDSWQGQ